MGWMLLAGCVALLVIVSLLGFAGCADILGLDEYQVPPDAPPTYGGFIAATPGLVAYWRLGEPAGTPTAATAKDEQNLSNGTYDEVQSFPPDTTLQSSGAPGTFACGEPSLIDNESSLTGVRFEGGLARVPWKSVLNDFPPEGFTIEAWVKPDDWTTPDQWSGDQPANHAVITSRDFAGTATTSGYQIYGSPVPNTTDKYRWQAGVANSNGEMVYAIPPNGTEIVFGMQYHLVMTYDGVSLPAKVKLFIDTPDPDTSAPRRRQLSILFTSRTPTKVCISVPARRGIRRRNRGFPSGASSRKWRSTTAR